MSLRSILSLPLEITIDDPWDFGTQCGVGPFAAEGTRLLELSLGEGLILRLRTACTYNEQICEFLIATPRHAGRSFADLLGGSTLPCNLAVLRGEEEAASVPADERSLSAHISSERCACVYDDRLEMTHVRAAR
jgi:hypothetical protein